MRATLSDPKTQQRIHFDRADLVALLSQLSEAERAELQAAVEENLRKEREDLERRLAAARDKERALYARLSRLTTEREAVSEELEVFRQSPAAAARVERAAVQARFNAVYDERARVKALTEEAQDIVQGLLWKLKFPRRGGG